MKKRPLGEPCGQMFSDFFEKSVTGNSSFFPFDNLSGRKGRVFVDGLEAELALKFKGVFCLGHLLLSPRRHLASSALVAELANAMTTRNSTTLDQTLHPVVFALGGTGIADSPLA